MKGDRKGFFQRISLECPGSTNHSFIDTQPSINLVLIPGIYVGTGTLFGDITLEAATVAGAEPLERPWKLGGRQSRYQIEFFCFPDFRSTTYSIPDQFPGD